MPENKLGSYNQVIEEIVAESIRCSPESWKKGTLSIDCDGRAINYKLKNSESEDKADISIPLRQLCEQLYVTMSQSGDTWTDAFIDFFQKGDSWGFDIKFEYATQQATPLPTNEKPWWKIW